MACPDLGPVAEGIGDAEWVLHAATQDLPCLAQVGLRPTKLFDTELGARLVGLPRVGLGAAVEHYLGLSLAKEHSAVDWSTRPLPEPWLRYAALDVEVLVELRDAIAADLEAQGKSQWARRGVRRAARLPGAAGPSRPVAAHLRYAPGPQAARPRHGPGAVADPRPDRRTPRHLAGRVLPDSVIVELANRAPDDRRGAGRGPRAAAGTAQCQGVAGRDPASAQTVPESALPPLTVPGTGPPPPRAWPERDPVAAARLAQAREGLAAFGAEHAVPVENLLTPDLLRRLIWSPPADLSAAGIAAALTALGARPWQVDIAAPIIAQACADHP